MVYVFQGFPLPMARNVSRKTSCEAVGKDHAEVMVA